LDSIFGDLAVASFRYRLETRATHYLPYDAANPRSKSAACQGSSAGFELSRSANTAEDGSSFRALAVTHRHGGLISHDGISRSPLFFGSCRGPGWVPHERERTQKIANCRRKKPRENKDVLLIQTAHNGLVAGSSPAGPTTLRPSGYAATRRSKGEACPAELERSESEAGLAGLLRTE